MASSELRIFDIHRFSTFDGKGIRTVIFFKGCPLNCLWCHNPESQKFEKELLYHEKRCFHCGECVRACGKNAVSMNAGVVNINRSKCTLCSICTEQCPSGAMEIAGYDISTDELFTEIIKDKKYFEMSGGGITFSGGEPLLQIKKLTNLIRLIKKENISIELETCLFYKISDVKNILAQFDTIYSDIKVIDAKKHLELTGVDNKIIKQNIRELFLEGFNLKIRYLLVPGLNDEEEDLLQLYEFLRENECSEIEILSYHDFGIEKYKSLQKSYELKNVGKCDKHTYYQIQKLLSDNGINVVFKK